MKKLFSAATSLVMAATMVGAIAPVGASAADTKKAFSVLPYKDATLPDGVTASGSTVTVSADAIAKGDVTVPLAIYLTEGTADTMGMQGGVTVKSDSKNVHDIKFDAFKPGDINKPFFSEAKSFKTTDGEFTSETPVAFVGSYDRREGYAPHGTFNAAATEKQDSANTPDAYLGYAWNNGGTKYTSWMGETSDTYPIVVFNVKLPKGIENGDYLIDFTNYQLPGGTNMSCIVESTSEKYSTATNNLDLNTLTIKVGDAASTTATTTSSQTTATTATTAGSSTTTTTVTTGSGSTPSDQKPGNSQIVADSDVVFDFTNPDSEDGYWRVDPEFNEVAVDVRLTNKTPITSITVPFMVEGGFTGTIRKTSPALGNESITANNKELSMGILCAGSDGYGLVASTSNPIVASLYLDPTGIKDGLYKVSLDPSRDLFVTDTDKKNIPITVIDGYILIGDEAPADSSTTTTSATTTTSGTTTTTTTASSAGTTTTTTASSAGTTTTTTSASSATTTTATTKAPTGAPNYGDTDCNGSVKINDVVLLNKWLNDNKSYDISEQGKLNADCYDPKGGAELTAEDSDAIIKSIVHLVTLPVEK